MSTDDASQVTMVPVKRYDVTLSLDDILTPLTQTVSNLQAAGMLGDTTDPEIGQHLQTFTDLVSQLQDVTSRINTINPNLLASKLGPPPNATTSA